MEKHLEMLDERINDDDKVVTVASFAYDAGLSLDDAKLAIRLYVEAPERAGKVSATYVLNGTLKNGKGITVSIVRCHELEERKQRYEDGAVATVFSVQKAAQIDFNFVALADPFCARHMEHAIDGSIVGKNCKKRASKSEAAAIAPDKSTVSEVRSKPDGLPKLVNTAGDSNRKRNSPTSKKNGISNFFNKMASREGPAPKKTATQGPAPEKTATQVGIKGECDAKVKEEKKIMVNGGERKRKAANGCESDKKRKRIMVVEDSESEDLFESDKEENASDKGKSDEEPEKTQPEPPASKSRRRKAVDRTYEDEEGFIVTRREYVYETASEEETTERAPSKVSETKNGSTPETKEKGGKGKRGAKKSSTQPTLMNFFSKK